MSKESEEIRKAIESDSIPELSRQLYRLLLDFITLNDSHNESCKSKILIYPTSFREFLGHCLDAADIEVPIKLTCVPCKEVWIAEAAYEFALDCPRCGRFPEQILYRLGRLMDKRYLKK